jgi:hypothetical protein
VLGFVTMFELDLCNDCDRLWSDDHNHIKLLIQIYSLVKFWGISIFFYYLYLALVPIHFSMIEFMSLLFLTQSDGEHQVRVRS